MQWFEGVNGKRKEKRKKRHLTDFEGWHIMETVKYKLNGCQSKEREQKHNSYVVQLFFFFLRNLYDSRGSILTAYINDIKQW